ncbi:MAG: patatin-like phospholipase family protein [Actinomycetes bacterium]
MRGQLENLGIRTFGDLATDDVSLPEERRYALVVTVTDLTLGRLVRLPWDYRRVYGRDPDEQSVADAVRASMSIPFVFQPVSLTSAARFTSTLVDGGVVSNFPIDSLDRIDGVKPRWPTFGVTVAHGSPAGGDRKKRSMASFGGGDLLERIVSTMLSGRDESYLEQPWVRARTIEVDSPGIRTFDFSITRSEIEECYAKGHAAAQDFLASWDWHSYCERFRVLP